MSSNEIDNIISLTDPEGNEVPFEFLDLVEYEGGKYVVLLPLDEEEEEVIILLLEEGEDDTESYISVEDEKTLNAVFEIFKEKFAEVFNFTDEA